MRKLSPTDPATLGRYRLLARLTPLSGELRWLAVAPGEEALTELTGTPHADPAWEATPYVPALTWAEALALHYGGLPHPYVRHTGATLAATLAELHTGGTAHGGITPDAVLLTATGPRLGGRRPPAQVSGAAPAPVPASNSNPARADDVAALAHLLARSCATEPPFAPLLRACLDPDPGRRPTAAALRDGLVDPDPTPVPPPARLLAALARQADEALALAVPAPEPDAEPARPAPPSRRRLLTAAATGLLLGATGVAAWVAARAGDLDALTSPGPQGEPSARGPVRGTAPPARWRYEATSGRIEQEVQLHAGRAYIPEPPDLTVLDLTDGSVLWTRRDMPRTVSVLPAGGGRLVSERAGRLVVLSDRDGTQLWTRRAALPGALGAVRMFATSADEHTVIYHSPAGAQATPTHRGLFVCLDLVRSTERWRTPVRTGSGSHIGFDLGDDGDHAFHTLEIVPSGGPPYPLQLSRFDATDGRVVWSRTHTWPHPDDRVLVHDHHTGQLVEVSRGVVRAARDDRDRPSWRLDLYGEKGRLRPTAQQVAIPRDVPGAGPTFFLANAEQTVFAVDLKAGRERWRTTLPARGGTGTRPEPPVVRTTDSGRTLLVASWDGVHALDSRSGAERWHFAAATGAAHPYDVSTRGEEAAVLNGPTIYLLPVT